MEFVTILTVDLERIVPEEKKPRLIAIGAGKKFLPEPAAS